MISETIKSSLFSETGGTPRCYSMVHTGNDSWLPDPPAYHSQSLTDDQDDTCSR